MIVSCEPEAREIIFICCCFHTLVYRPNLCWSCSLLPSAIAYPLFEPLSMSLPSPLWLWPPFSPSFPPDIFPITISASYRRFPSAHSSLFLPFSLHQWAARHVGGVGSRDWWRDWWCNWWRVSHVSRAPPDGGKRRGETRITRKGFLVWVMPRTQRVLICLWGDGFTLFGYTLRRDGRPLLIFR